MIWFEQITISLKLDQHVIFNKAFVKSTPCSQPKHIFVFIIIKPIEVKTFIGLHFRKCLAYHTQCYYFLKYLIWGPKNRSLAKRIRKELVNITTVQIYIISIQYQSFSKRSQRFQGTKINTNLSIPRPNLIVVVIGRAQLIVHRSSLQI